MPSAAYEISYPGNKNVEQRTFVVCQECNSLLKSVPSRRVNQFKSQTCPGCSKIIREGPEGKERPDYSSFVITVLEHLTASPVISRLSRETDVTEKLDGAVRNSRAVTKRHDVIQAHVYADKDVRTDNPKEALKTVDKNLFDAVNVINSLDNFESEIDIERSDFTDIYVFIYHVSASR